MKNQIVRISVLALISIVVPVAGMAAEPVAPVAKSAPAPRKLTYDSAKAEIAATSQKLGDANLPEDKKAKLLPQINVLLDSAQQDLARTDLARVRPAMIQLMGSAIKYDDTSMADNLLNDYKANENIYRSEILKLPAGVQDKVRDSFRTLIDADLKRNGAGNGTDVGAAAGGGGVN